VLPIKDGAWSEIGSVGQLHAFNDLSPTANGLDIGLDHCDEMYVYHSRSEKSNIHTN
jgi:hypothetical protein